jgi:hypothetical protein
MPLSLIGSISLLQIRDELNPADNVPYSLEDYYPAVGGIVPAGLVGRLGKIPGAGNPLSFNHFRGVNRFEQNSYSRPFFTSSNGNLDILFGGRIPVDNNWYPGSAYPVDITPPDWEGTPVGVSTGYTLTLPNITGQFACAFTTFSDSSYGSYRRYFRVRRFGYRLFRSTGTEYTLFNTYYSSDTEIIGIEYQPLSTGSWSIFLEPQYKWRVQYYLEFKGDNSSGDAVSGDNRFAGYIDSFDFYRIRIN